jgi:hypothetical protein
MKKSINTQFGAISRFPIWTFGAARPTRHSSTTSIAVVAFTTRYSPSPSPSLLTTNDDMCFDHTNSVGVTRPFIQSPRRSSRARTEYSFSGRSDTSTLHTHIVRQKRTYGSKLAVVANHHAALVILLDHRSWYQSLMCPLLLCLFIDYDGYSCMSKWDRIEGR